MTGLWLSRISLCKGTNTSEFWSQGQALRDPHRLIWSFFPSPEGTPRSFLFRQENQGEDSHFYALSPRRAEAPSAIWEVKSQKFAPKLRVGQVLQFSLRANAVQRVINVQKRWPALGPEDASRLQGQIQGRIARRENTEPGDLAHARSSDDKHDVVMLRKLGQRHLPDGEREPEPVLVRRAGLDWLRRQAKGDGRQNKGAGFSFLDEEVQADGYRQHRVARRSPGRRWQDMTFSTIEFSGLLEITDPALMIERLWAGSSPGLGSARGFGCGLMLVRPGPPRSSAQDDEDGEDDE